MIVMLPCSENPSLKTYPYTATYSAILQSNGVSVWNFYFRYFLHMFADPTSGYINFRKRFYLQSLVQKEHFVIQKETIIKTLCDYLNQEKYIMIDLSFGGKRAHDFFIYGYDNKKCIFYVYGFLGGTLAKYSSFEVPFKELTQNATDSNKGKTIGARRALKNCAFWFPENITNRNLTKKQVVTKIKQYVHCPRFFIFNKMVYKNLIFHIRLRQRNSSLQKARFMLDLREARILWEHSQIMAKALVFVEIKKKFISQYEHEVVDRLRYLLLIEVKFYLVEDQSVKNRIIEQVCFILNDIYHNENRLLKQSLKSLKSKKNI